jgi:mono/diheme cytochrome c family protein
MPLSCRQLREGAKRLKALKLAGVVTAALVALLAAAFGGAWWLGERKLARAVDVRVVPVAYAKDPASQRQGKYLYESRGCGECHGRDGAGRVMIDNRDGLYVRTPNLTRGPGSAVSGYTEADWVRSIRHGVSPQGRALLSMPSEDYNRLSDADFAALVAYVRALPPAPGEPALVRLPPLLRALYGVGLLPDAAEKIDHRLPPAPAVPAAANVAYGAYVANMCVGCHGRTFAGGRIAGGPPEWPPASNLTPASDGVMGRYDTPEKFAALMRTGQRPDGSAVSAVMPFGSLALLNDLDLNALHAYLHTLPARETGAR